MELDSRLVLLRGAHDIRVLSFGQQAGDTSSLSQRALRSNPIVGPYVFASATVVVIIGGQGRNRTADAGLFRAALYQLSYLASGEKERVV